MKRLDFFERYLTFWVALCMIAGITLGKMLPELTGAVRRWELGEGSQVNGPIAVLIWMVIGICVVAYLAKYRSEQLAASTRLIIGEDE